MAAHGANTWMAVVIVVVVLAFMGWAFSNPWIGIPLIFALSGAGYYFGRPFQCEMCKTLLLRNRFVWTLDDKKLVVCPACNRALQKKHGKHAPGSPGALENPVDEIPVTMIEPPKSDDAPPDA